MLVTWNVSKKSSIFNHLTTGHGKMGVLLDGSCQEARNLMQAVRNCKTPYPYRSIKFLRDLQQLQTVKMVFFPFYC